MDGIAPLAEELAHFVVDFDLKTDPASASLLERAKLHLLDAIGLALVGWRAEDAIGDTLVRGLRSSGGAGTVIGSDTRLSAADAALVNAALATVWTFDDADPVTTMHCEAFATAATLAAAEEAAASGLALAEGFVVAAEVALRLASAVDTPGGLYHAGFHATSVFGTLGAAAGVAKVLGLGAEETADALALAASFASGTAAGWTEASGRNKTLHPGWAAHSGVIAAKLASSGYSCSHTTIDGERGLLDAHTTRGRWSRDPILAGIGEDWRLFDLYMKKYPSGSGTQAALAAALTLYHRDGVRADNVVSGTVTVPAQFAGVLTDIGDSLYRPETGSASIGSFPLVVARCLMEGNYTLAHRTDDAVREHALLAVADRFAVRPDHEHLDLPPEHRPTIVEVVTSSATVRALGVPGNDTLGRADVLEKFTANATMVVSSAAAEKISKLILDIESLTDVRGLTTLLGEDSTAAAHPNGNFGH